MRGYKKKKSEKSILLGVLAGALLLSTAAHAENITYTGGGKSGTDPQNAWITRQVRSGTSRSGNNVTVKGIKETDRSNTCWVYGGLGGSAVRDDVADNTVTVTGSAFGDGTTATGGNGTWGIYGGKTTGFGEVRGNCVIITDESRIRTDIVAGGWDERNGKVKGNSVLIEGGSFVKATSAAASGVYGGYAKEQYNNDLEVDIGGNSVTVDGNAEIDAPIYGGYAKTKTRLAGVIHDNEVNIKSGTVASTVTGGYSERGLNEVSNNEVNISGGTITGDVYGGFADKDESIAESGSGKVAENRVNISGGEIEGDIYGGKSSGGDLNGNKVVLSSKVEGKIYGAYAEELREGATVTGNTITLLKGAEVENADLYGAHIASGGTTGSGNALLVDGWQGTVNSLHDLNEIVFKCLPWQDGGTVLTITDGVSSDLSDTTVSVDRLTLENGRELGVGKKMTLLERADGLELQVKDDDVTIDEFTAGTSLRGTLEHRKENNKLVVEIESVESQLQNEPLAEARAMALSFVNVSEDLIHEALENLGRDREEGIKTFAMGSGTKSNYDLGNGLKLNGWSFLTGIDDARRIGKNDEELNVALFFETGTGNYRLYNTFYDAAGSATNFRGDGSMSYNGGGLAARLRKKNGVYFEGSMRGGLLKNNIANGVMDDSGNTYGYETETKYFGLHAGIGRSLHVGEHSVLDVYGKYFHTYTEKDSWELATGDPYELDGIKSDRVRLGGRVTTDRGGAYRYYCGLAYEYEFSGDAHLKTSGVPVDADGLRGGTGILELGINFKESHDSPWSLDFNVKGYAGVREGVSAQLQATYGF